MQSTDQHPSEFRQALPGLLWIAAVWPMAWALTYGPVGMFTSGLCALSPNGGAEIGGGCGGLLLRSALLTAFGAVVLIGLIRVYRRVDTTP